MFRIYWTSRITNECIELYIGLGKSVNFFHAFTNHQLLVKCEGNSPISDFFDGIIGWNLWDLSTFSLRFEFQIEFRQSHKIVNSRFECDFQMAWLDIDDVFVFSLDRDGTVLCVWLASDLANWLYVCARTKFSASAQYTKKK